MVDQNNNSNTNNNNDNNTSDTITVTGKPSTGQAAKFYEYKNYTKTWKNYCPLCGRSGKLSDNPKGTAEGELTCDKSKGGCDADYDICTGGDKSGKYRAYLQDASGRSNTKESVDTSIGGEGGGTTGTTTQTSSGGSAVQIDNQTFYGLIKQMVGATDSVFITANNMAYLLSYTDLFKLRNKYEQYIPTIKPSHILRDSIIQYWTTEGLYNAVEVTYKEGTIRYQHDLLVKQYGNHTYYCEFKEDDEETAIAKARALLAAHVRDYSLDLQFNCIYNPYITVGSWVKVPKSVTKAETKQDQDQKPISAKRKGVTITNLNQTVQQEQNGTKTIIQEITTDDKKTTEVKLVKTDYDIYYVQGMKYWYTPDHSPIVNLHLKYGPDTPEDPINATIGTGGGGGTVTSGQWGSDTFTIADICVANNKKIMGRYSGGANVQKVKEMVNGEYAPDPSNYQPRANKDSNYAKKYGAMSSPEEVYAAFRDEYNYSLYANNAPCWKSATDFYDNAGKTANCGDTTCLLKVFFDCIGVPSCGVHIDGHYFNAIQINGVWEIIDGVRIDNQTCGFSASAPYTFGNPGPCTSYTGGSQ